MKDNSRRNTLIGFTVGLVMLGLTAFPAFAQEEMPSQINLQLSGLINTDSTGNGVTDHATKSAGLLANYTYLFNKWAGVEGTYGYSRNTQDYSASGVDIGGVQAGMHQFSAAFRLGIPSHSGKLRPYALAGTGALLFSPTTNMNNTAGADTQTKGIFLYGGGADFAVATHIGIRAEYRALLYKAPDFTLTGMTTDSVTHLAEPSVGVFFRF